MRRGEGAAELPVAQLVELSSGVMTVGEGCGFKSRQATQSRRAGLAVYLS